MAISLVQTIKAAGSNVSTISTTGAATTTGNLVHADMMWYTPSGVTLSSFTDTAGNALSGVAIANWISSNGSGSSVTGQSNFQKNAVGNASNVYTMTLSGNSFPTLFVLELAGADTTSPLRLGEVSSPPSTPTATPNYTTTGSAVAGDFAIATSTQDLTATTLTSESPGWTSQLSNATGTVANDATQTALSGHLTYVPVYSTSSRYSISIAAYIPGSGGSTVALTAKTRAEFKLKPATMVGTTPLAAKTRAELKVKDAASPKAQIASKIKAALRAKDAVSPVATLASKLRAQFKTKDATSGKTTLAANVRAEFKARGALTSGLIFVATKVRAAFKSKSAIAGKTSLAAKVAASSRLRPSLNIGIVLLVAKVRAAFHARPSPAGLRALLGVKVNGSLKIKAQTSGKTPLATKARAALRLRDTLTASGALQALLSKVRASLHLKGILHLDATPPAPDEWVCVGDEVAQVAVSQDTITLELGEETINVVL